MGWKSQATEAVFKGLTKWGGDVGHKIFGKEIPQEVTPLFSKGGISPVDAQTFGRAIEFDPEVREGLDGLFRQAASGNDDAYMLLEAAAKNFADEDQVYRTLNKTQQNLAKKQRGAYNTLQGRIDAAPTATGSSGRTYTANVAGIGRNQPPVDTGIPMQASAKQADPVDYTGSSQYSGQGNPLSGDSITQVHHGGGLDDLSWLFKHKSMQAVGPNSPHPLIEMGDKLFGLQIGNSPQNTVDILGMLNKRGRNARVAALSEQVGDVMHSKTIDDLLGTSDFKPAEIPPEGLAELEQLREVLPDLSVEKYMDTGRNPVTGKAYPKGGVTSQIEIWKPGANTSKASDDFPLEVIKLNEKTYPNRVKLAFDAYERHGIDVSQARKRWNKKLAKVDPNEDILGVDHPLVHEYINTLKKQDGTALNTITKMSDDEIFNMPTEQAFKLYVRQMQEMETVLANVLTYRYNKVKEIFKELNPKKSYDRLTAPEKQVFFRKNVNTIAVRGNIDKDLSLKAATRPLKKWNNHIADTFGWRPQTLFKSIEEIEEVAQALASKDQPATILE